jgi:hypothetical protein
VGVANLGVGPVDATSNWWDCQTGPAAGNCASAQGSGLVTTPWLTAPYTAADADDF